MTKKAERRLKQQLVEFVQREMPWPFEDVSRHDTEGLDAARCIADELMPHFAKQFDDILADAKRAESAHVS